MRVLLPLLLAGCSNSFKSTSGVELLPDLLSDLDTDGCADVDGIPVEGATSYFYGELAQESLNGSWSGSETWLLFSNPSWKATGQDDCQIVWSILADEVSPSTCSQCDIGLLVQANLIAGETSCPESLYAGLEEFSVGYEISREDDGSSLWFFTDSGDSLGSGHHAEGALNYLSVHQCVWF